jgi:hypothetical protein
MTIFRFWNATRQNEVVARCQLADKFWTRGKGLLGRSHLPAEEGILLVPGTSIHMFGMKFPIDVVFLTKEDVVTDIAPDIAPGKMHVAKAGAGKPFAALELAAGTIARCQIGIGDRLERQS